MTRFVPFVFCSLLFSLSNNLFAVSSVVINELMPANSETFADEYDEYDDWIEIYNTASFDLDISAYYLSDSKTSPLKWQFPSGTVIEAGGYLIVWADDDLLQTSGLHANFKLSANGETVFLSDKNGNLIDQVKYGNNISNISYARKTDGTGEFTWQNATPAYANQDAEAIAPPDTVSFAVVINELMPSNVSAKADAMGEFDDWIELYNTSSEEVDLSKYYLTSDAGNLVKWQFPLGTVIPANAYLTVWMDDDESQSGLHANFKLPQDGGYVLLTNENREIAGYVTYPEFFENAAYARQPNGTGGFVWKNASPETDNDQVAEFALPEEVNDGLLINEMLVSNVSGVTDPNGQYEDWIELYNASADTIDLSAYYLTDNFYNTRKWNFPKGTLIAPDAYVVVWADDDGLEMGLHANFKLSADGESVYLYNASGQIADKVTYQKTDSVDLGYARMPNGEGSFVWQMPTFADNNTTNGTASQTFYMNQGWNLIGFNIALQNNSVARLSTDLNLSIVKKDDDFYSVNADAFLCRLQYVTVGEGYLAYCDSETTVTLTGYYPSKYGVRTLSEGWNYCAVPLAEDLAVDQLPENVKMIKSLDSYYNTETKEGTINVLQAGKAYFFNLDSDITIDWDAF